MPRPDRERRRGADQVYHLSLTELAFVLIFLLLVLAGWIVFRSDQERRTALAENAALKAEAGRLASRTPVPGVDDATLRELLAVLSRLTAAKPSQNPDALISDLVQGEAMQAENQRLRARIQDLDGRLSALAEVQNGIATASMNRDGTAAADGTARQQIQDEITSALRFRAALADAAGVRPEHNRESDLAGQLAEALRQFNAVQRAEEENAKPLEDRNRDLQGQVDFLRNQLGGRGGRDFPPCWAEPGSGKVQFLFNIELRDSGLAVSPAWPPERDADAHRLPGIDALAGALPIGQFKARVQPIDRDSRVRHCRHYVRLVNRVKNLEAFNRNRYAVEEFFYKLEVR